MTRDIKGQTVAGKSCITEQIIHLVLKFNLSAILQNFMLCGDRSTKTKYIRTLFIYFLFNQPAMTSLCHVTWSIIHQGRFENKRAYRTYEHCESDIVHTF